MEAKDVQLRRLATELQAAHTRSVVVVVVAVVVVSGVDVPAAVVALF